MMIIIHHYFIDAVIEKTRSRNSLFDISRQPRDVADLVSPRSTKAGGLDLPFDELIAMVRQKPNKSRVSLGQWIRTRSLWLGSPDRRRVLAHFTQISVTGHKPLVVTNSPDKTSTRAPTASRLTPFLPTHLEPMVIT